LRSAAPNLSFGTIGPSPKGDRVTDEPSRTINDSNDRIGIILIVTVIVVALLAIFVIQNGLRVRVEFLVFGVSLPVWLIVAISMVIGALLALVWRMARGRRARR
jgi:uncharacterized integral membrane protein